MNMVLAVIAFGRDQLIIATHTHDDGSIVPTALWMDFTTAKLSHHVGEPIASQHLDEIITESVAWALQQVIFPSVDFMIMACSLREYEFYQDLIQIAMNHSLPVFAPIENRVH